MSIQWFPGHMHKAGKEMDAVLPTVDVVVEIIDARLPWSSSNPQLDARIGDKPRLRIMTRRDLADPALTDVWLEALTSEDTGEGQSADSTGGTDSTGGNGGTGDGTGNEGTEDTKGIKGIESEAVSAKAPRFKTLALAIQTDAPETARDIPAHLRALFPEKRGKSNVGPRTAMIAGIPNVGKSTLINRLAGRTIAKTGNEPAVTKRQQSVAISEDWRLRDTPGVLWPKVENPASGYRLAASGAIRDTAMDSAEVAAWLLEYLVQAYPELLEARYGSGLPADDGVATLEAIGKARGCLGGGRLVDFDRAGRLVLHEFRSGQIGRITLETPVMRDAEMIETEARRVALEEKRAERREARKKRRSKRR